MQQSQRARIEITRNRHGSPKGVRAASDGPEAPIDLKMADLVFKQYPGLPAVYNLMSGVTHGLPYQLADNAHMANRQITWDTNPLDVASSVLVSLHAANTVLARVGWYRGTADDPAITAARRRVAAVDTAMIRYGRIAIPLPKPMLSRAAGMTSGRQG